MNPYAYRARSACRLLASNAPSSPRGSAPPAFIEPSAPHPETAPALLPSGDESLLRGGGGAIPQVARSNNAARKFERRRKGNSARAAWLRGRALHGGAELAIFLWGRCLLSRLPGDEHKPFKAGRSGAGGCRVQKLWAVTQSHSPWGPRVPWTCKRERAVCVSFSRTHGYGPGDRCRAATTSRRRCTRSASARSFLHEIAVSRQGSQI
jgi:hypothetical protein